MPLRDWLLGLIGRGPRAISGQPRERGPATHVIILDGTMSTLMPGCETNAGLAYKLLDEVGHSANLTVYYEAGVQWRDWKTTPDVAAGKGINRQIKRAYGVLASRYHPGDKIILMGYSRGAYAARSLAGVVDMVGLVKAECATERVIQTAYRHYEAGATSTVAAEFWKEHCHPRVEIEAIGVWDTVKSLGLVAPVIWRISQGRHAFHNHHLGHAIKHGFHALALHETRVAYRPVMWETDPNWSGHVEQVWFRGSHGDVGGQLSGFEAARPLANIPLVWMLDRLEQRGLPLPQDWSSRFHCDATAPSAGSWRGWGKIFVTRRKRVAGLDPSERLHDTVPADDPRAVLFRARAAAKMTATDQAVINDNALSGSS